jgi:hypothetical protein
MWSVKQSKTNKSRQISLIHAKNLKSSEWNNKDNQKIQKQNVQLGHLFHFFRLKNHLQ